MHSWEHQKASLIYMYIYIKINFITSKQTITITRTVQLLMHDTKSDEEMDYKRKNYRKGGAKQTLIIIITCILL